MFDDAVISEAARRLCSAAPHARAIVFGSYARRDAGPDSDLDFLVIEPAVEDVAQESVRLRETLYGLGLFADVIVASKHEVDQWGAVHGNLIHAGSPKIAP